MNGQEEVLVGGGTEYVCYSPEFPGPKGRRLEEVGEDDLKCHDAGDDVLG